MIRFNSNFLKTSNPVVNINNTVTETAPLPAPAQDISPVISNNNQSVTIFNYNGKNQVAAGGSTSISLSNMKVNPVGYSRLDIIITMLYQDSATGDFEVVNLQEATYAASLNYAGNKFSNGYFPLLYSDDGNVNQPPYNLQGKLDNLNLPIQPLNYSGVNSQTDFTVLTGTFDPVPVLTGSSFSCTIGDFSFANAGTFYYNVSVVASPYSMNQELNLLNALQSMVGYQAQMPLVDTWWALLNTTTAQTVYFGFGLIGPMLEIAGSSSLNDDLLPAFLGSNSAFALLSALPVFDTYGRQVNGQLNNTMLRFDLYSYETTAVAWTFVAGYLQAGGTDGGSTATQTFTGTVPAASASGPGISTFYVPNNLTNNGNGLPSGVGHQNYELNFHPFVAQIIGNTASTKPVCTLTANFTAQANLTMTILNGPPN